MNHALLSVLTFDDSGVSMFIAMVVSVKGTQVNVATSFEFS